MTAWLLLGHALLAGLVVYFYGRAQHAGDAVELWQTQAKRLTADLTNTVQAAAENQQRREQEIHALQVELEGARRQMSDLAHAHPDLAAEYLRGQLLAFRLAADAGASAPVPEPATAAGPAGRGRGDGH